MASKKILNDISSSIREYRNLLLSRGIAIQYSQMENRKMGGGNIYLGTPGGGFSVYGENNWTNLEVFLRLIDNKDYFLIFGDGSLVNLSFVISNNVLRQRLSFIPCPFDLKKEDIHKFGLSELVKDSLSSIDPSSLRLVPRMRFEFDRDADSNHPRGHLHIGSSNCRIPTKAPVNIERFLSFIFTHFYDGHESLASTLLSYSKKEDKTIREPNECGLMYLNWTNYT